VYVFNTIMLWGQNVLHSRRNDWTYSKQAMTVKNVEWQWMHI